MDQADDLCMELGRGSNFQLILLHLSAEFLHNLSWYPSGSPSRNDYWGCFFAVAPVLAGGQVPNSGTGRFLFHTDLKLSVFHS